MNRRSEILFLTSIASLQISGFLQSGNPESIISGDNLLLIPGFYIAFLNKEIKKVKLNSISVSAFMFGVITILLVPLYVDIKDSVVFGTDVNMMKFVRTGIRLFMVYSFVSYLSISVRNFKLGVLVVLVMGSIIAISMYVPEFFESLGFSVIQWGIQDDMSNPERFAGISGANVNAAGAMLTTLFAATLYMLQMKLIKPKTAFMLSALFFIGIFRTASRTAIIITIVIYIIYLFQSQKKINIKKISLNFIALAVFIIFFYYYGETVLTRFETNQKAGYGGLGGRMSYWVMYLNDIINNPHYLLVGNNKPSTYERSPHNNYIWIMFHAGAVFLIFAFMNLRKVFGLRKNVIRNTILISIDPLYIATPILLYWVTGTYPISWYGLILLMATGIFLNKNLEITDLLKDSNHSNILAISNRRN
ncbi:MAG: hypothetical protein K9G57_03415 [Ignavibacteriales bacterium]|nr:hypothetical protein [Ignavibacteriales bacterium]